MRHRACSSLQAGDPHGRLEQSLEARRARTLLYVAAGPRNQAMRLVLSAILEGLECVSRTALARETGDRLSCRPQVVAATGRGRPDLIRLTAAWPTPSAADGTGPAAPTALGLRGLLNRMDASRA